MNRCHVQSKVKLWITSAGCGLWRYRQRVRWDKLFDDLESQLARELDTEDLELAAEDERLRLARLALRERLRALQRQGDDIRLVLIDGSTVQLRADAFGRDWCSGQLQQRGRSCLLPLASIAAVSLPVTAASASVETLPEPERGDRLTARLGLGFVLRDLCRRRQPVTVRTLDGELHGTIDRIGRDHLDLAVHEQGVPRRDSAVRELRIIPLERVVLIVL